MDDPTSLDAHKRNAIPTGQHKTLATHIYFSNQRAELPDDSVQAYKGHRCVDMSAVSLKMLRACMSRAYLHVGSENRGDGTNEELRPEEFEKELSIINANFNTLTNHVEHARRSRT